MNGRLNRLFCVVLIAIIVSVISGCEQSSDVVAPASATTLTLNPVRLFNPPDGYAYALWVIDTLDRATFIDIFGWDRELYKFRDTLGNAIENVWETNINVLDPLYRFVALSIEDRSSFDTASMGPVMLMDTIVDPSAYSMTMVFPLKLWEGEGFFCMETPTDGNSNTNEASGVWFALYIYDSVVVWDTTNVRSTTAQSDPRVKGYDTLYWICNEYDGPKCIDSTFVPRNQITSPDDYDFFRVDSLGELDVTYFVCTATDINDDCIDSVGYSRNEVISQGIQYDWIVVNTLDTIGFCNLDVNVKDTLLWSGAPYNNDRDTAYLDTIQYNRCTFDWVATPVNISNTNRIDTVRIVFEIPVTVTVGPFRNFKHLQYTQYTRTSRIIRVDRFLTGFDTETTPDLTGTGWHYRGWVLSPRVNPEQFGTLTKPAWTAPSMQLYLDPSDAGVVSTGSFYRFDMPDIENPYTQRNPHASPNMSRVPPFPGEDFLSNLPGGSPLSFILPGQTAPQGRVFITVEPDNYWDPDTNFPLVLFTRSFPSYGAISQTVAHSNANFEMFNLYHTTNVGYGMPTISLKIAVK
jgi:hypothetical protein